MTKKKAVASVGMAAALALALAGVPATAFAAGSNGAVPVNPETNEVTITGEDFTSNYTESEAEVTFEIDYPESLTIAMPTRVTGLYVGKDFTYKPDVQGTLAINHQVYLSPANETFEMKIGNVVVANVEDRSRGSVRLSSGVDNQYNIHSDLEFYWYVSQPETYVPDVLAGKAIGTQTYILKLVAYDVE